MQRRGLVVKSVVILLSSSVASASAVDLSISMHRTDMNTIFPMTVTFDIKAELWNAPNSGLALVGLDLSATLDEQPFNVTGATVTRALVGMDSFVLANPAGFGGTPIQDDLVQIGAAQNTMTSAGTVVLNVAAFGTLQTIAQVSITLNDPPSPCSEYLFTIDNAFANVIKEGETVAPFACEAVATVHPDALVIPLDPCPADFDGSGDVRVPDLIFLLGEWGDNPGSPADFDCDGLVRVPDLIVLLGAWGACPE